MHRLPTLATHPRMAWREQGAPPAQALNFLNFGLPQR
jgi:hypothetical protein